jgi:hypothetical protein
MEHAAPDLTTAILRGDRFVATCLPPVRSGQGKIQPARSEWRLLLVERILRLQMTGSLPLILPRVADRAAQP